MDLETTIPVRLAGPQSIAPLLEQVHQRITLRAYEYFIDRGGVHGEDMGDWFKAERDLLIRPAVLVHTGIESVFIEVIMPEIDIPDVTVHVAPRRLVVSSEADENGFQLCEVIDLPLEITLDDVEAEQLRNSILVALAVAQPGSSAAAA